jgi:TctA family transporter
MSRGSPLKGVAMTLFGILCGVVGTDVTSGTIRFSFGIPQLADGIELGALCMGLFGIADFLISVNRTEASPHHARVRMRDMQPTRAEIRRSFFPMLRGTLIGTLFGAMPGTGPTITTFIAYAFERKISKTPEKFGTGMIEGVAAPEAASHSKTQVDFIPTMSLGVPGDPVMALLLGALIIKGVQPGPQLITAHPDIFWGLIASFWIGNVLLLIVNIPMIGVWVKMLQVPYRLLFPSAIFFICVGVYSTNNDLFNVAEVAVLGVVGAILLSLKFPVSPIILGFVLGPMLEENFRRALLESHGDLAIFIQHPISAFFVAMCLILLLAQIIAYLRRLGNPNRAPIIETQLATDID